MAKKTSYATSEARMDKLNKLAEKHGKTLTGMIDNYVALGMMFEDLLKDDGEIVIVKKKDVDKIADKTVVPFRYLIEAG
jgi:hypothetical protein